MAAHWVGTMAALKAAWTADSKVGKLAVMKVAYSVGQTDVWMVDTKVASTAHW